MPRAEYRRGMLHGNGDHSANGTRLEKLVQMQGSIMRRRMPMKMIRPAMIYRTETLRLATTKRQENWIHVNEMRMLRWMNGVTRKDKIWNEHLITRNNESGVGFQKDH